MSAFATLVIAILLIWISTVIKTMIHGTYLRLICDKNGMIQRYKTLLFGFHDPPDKLSVGHYKLMMKESKQELIYEFESLHKKIKPITCEIGYQNIALLYIVNEQKPSPKIYNPSDIDIPLLGNVAEIMRNYQSFFEGKEGKPSIELNTVSCRKQLLDESKKYYMDIVNVKYGYK